MNVQKISEFGTSYPWSARVGVQGIRILELCQASDECKAQANAALMTLHQRLVPLQKATDELANEVSHAQRLFDETVNNLSSAAPGALLPSVPDLQSKAEGYVQAAKIAIAATPGVISAFYGENFDHRFNKVVKWAEKKFGSSDPFTENMRRCEIFVQKLLELRNAVEHPGGSAFFVTNIMVDYEGPHPSFRKPGWGIVGESETDMLADMEAILEAIVEVNEWIVIELFFKLKPDVPMHIEEIPKDERNPLCPIRYQAVPSIFPTIER